MVGMGGIMVDPASGFLRHPHSSRHLPEQACLELLCLALFKEANQGLLRVYRMPWRAMVFRVNCRGQKDRHCPHAFVRANQRLRQLVTVQAKRAEWWARNLWIVVLRVIAIRWEREFPEHFAQMIARNLPIFDTHTPLPVRADQRILSQNRLGRVQ